MKKVLLKIKQIILENKIQFFFCGLFLLFLTYRFFDQTNELDKYGVTVEGTVIECKKVRLNGACHVKITYETKEKINRVSEGTLYYDENCLLGKKIKIRYSTKSTLFDPIEE